MLWDTGRKPVLTGFSKMLKLKHTSAQIFGVHTRERDMHLFAKEYFKIYKLVSTIIIADY
jgi:hypothetical protein